ncbi:hypothetical protein C5615_35055 [Burkholderia cepacia]|uniref:Uncharacterized protein n=1 Tax=Burkholderia cepacia TaxID=292 RepID=A0A2S8I3N6_BURCE|nr:hypothetical protein C5615_35055 [Burkholderia cepacia]
MGGLLIKRTTRPVSKKGSNAAPHSRLAIAHCRSGVTATRIISKYYIEVTRGSVEVCASLCGCVAIVFPCRRGPARAACPSIEVAALDGRSRRSAGSRQNPLLRRPHGRGSTPLLSDLKAGASFALECPPCPPWRPPEAGLSHAWRREFRFAAGRE